MDLPESPRARDALAYALERLASRDRFEAEIRAELTVREYSELEIAEVLSYLLRRRLLDDRKTIQSLIERNTGRRSVGKGKLSAELLRRGAPEDAVDEELSRRTDEEEFESMRLALESKRWRSGDRVRAARFLISRGFEEELVESALDRFLGPEELPA
jgi:SOS response regulatory protein OraA/RecX